MVLLGDSRITNRPQPLPGSMKLNRPPQIRMQRRRRGHGMPCPHNSTPQCRLDACLPAGRPALRRAGL